MSRFSRWWHKWGRHGSWWQGQAPGYSIRTLVSMVLSLKSRFNGSTYPAWSWRVSNLCSDMMTVVLVEVGNGVSTGYQKRHK